MFEEILDIRIYNCYIFFRELCLLKWQVNHHDGWTKLTSFKVKIAQALIMASFLKGVGVVLV